MSETYERTIKPILPKTFDENEWFAIFITELVLSAVYYVTIKNRKLLWSQIICISLLNLQMTTVGDYFLAMPPYDFYDTVDRNSGELTDVFLQNIVYPGTVLFIMHWYKRIPLNKLSFLVLSVLLLSTLEGISVYFFHLFTYKSWKFYYSVIFYTITMVLNLVFYEKLHNFLQGRMAAAK
ncbi:hypothetical protein DYI25_18610 [Mesobacillus boroniphilus]|uniref:Uncharacterized protein n=1 Tax=Mesobacillus boroniphilus TaxID=308892 RepID=A0A944GZG4_9BACI|nr:hypothetical protein [Mesobacillus boroniphilus]MBS8266436.1 hypothetical protein [Mesobacillus boroniphilus]